MAEEANKLSLTEKILGFFRGVKAEYSKIIFPNQDTVKKQAVAVCIASLFIGVLIFVIDFILKYALGFIL